MEIDKITSLVEAVMFLENEPVELKTIQQITNYPKESVLKALNNLQERYRESSCGIEIIKVGGGYLLTPKSCLWEQLRNRYMKKNENKLSKAALETLSIIAYSQPVTKTEIENIRGVSADGMLSMLLNLKYIKFAGKKDAPGKPRLFATTKDFLIAFNLNSISDLPKLDDLNKEIFEINE